VIVPPLLLVGVNVELFLVASLNVPVAAGVTIDHKPVEPPPGAIAASATAWLRHVVLSAPAFAAAATTTFMVLDPLQPVAVVVTVHVRTIVVPASFVGVNVEVGDVASLNVPVAPTVAIVQAPVFPVPAGVAASVTAELRQVDLSGPAAAVGFALIGTSVEAWAEVHPSGYVTMSFRVTLPVPPAV
jgi:hypothetical protein